MNFSEETEGAMGTSRDWRKSTTKTPIFVSSVPLNVTIQYGAHAHLVCRVQDAGNKSVLNVNSISKLFPATMIPSKFIQTTFSLLF